MSQPSVNAKTDLPTWVDSLQLNGMLRGIERESLRMQANGFLAQTSHPQSLGSALTHPHITTDYSEALMEFITPPRASIQDALQDLTDIHTVVHRHLEQGEQLWPLSMPCMLENDEEKIRLAEYGSSNIGQFKTLYRRGLGVRYGRRMQTIAGVHYNLSFPDPLFEQLQQQETDEALKALSFQDYRSHRYFGLIRNFIRLTPLTILLVGASPAVCQCFMSGREHALLPLLPGTLYLPDATALRMGRFGYQNSAQKQLGINYNNMAAYLEGLQKAVNTSYVPFSRLGLDDKQGNPLQINDHILQIENEYYSLVRPKQVPEAGETPSQALANRGVGYVELRAVDINPYSPIGIDETTAGFLEALALYCLLQDSPEISDQEQATIERNQAEVVSRGRAENASIVDEHGEYLIEDWCHARLDELEAMASALDRSENTSLYTQALAEMRQRIYEVDDTLSARMIEDTLSLGGTWYFGYHLAQQHAEAFEKNQLSLEREAYFEQLAQQSLQQQQQLEQENKISFTDYLAAYRSH